MRRLVNSPKSIQPATSAKSIALSRRGCRQSCEGEVAAQHSTTTNVAGASHDFSRVPVHGLSEDESQVVRGGGIGEAIGDVVRPVGATLGNVVGAVTGALTGISISSATNTGPVWRPGGEFDWKVGFSTTGRSGWIVQEVVNGWRAQTAAGAAIPNPATPHYWEAWAVDATGNVSPSRGATNDIWGNPDFSALLHAPEGHWSTASSLYFTTTDPATQGFVRNNAATNAGILLSSTSAPASLGIARLNRWAQGSWDSTGATPTHTGSAGP